MSSTVEQIKNRLSIEDVVSTYIKIERAGKNMRALCPFHNEKTPSFFISPDRGVYHCFGCGQGGDMFSFVEQFEGVDFLGALKVLADRAGVEISPIDPAVEDKRQRLLRLLDLTASHFELNLSNSKGAKKYLRDRTINDETIRQFRIGYASDEWRELREYFLSKGYTDDELEEVGLIKHSESGKKYDTFRGRIMFPIFDAAVRAIAFSGRSFPDKDLSEAPKYLNSPETKFFNKSQVLYGFESAKIAIRKNDFCILVEGQIDVILAHQAGYRNTVAPLGTALTLMHLKRLRQLTKNILFAFDADSAGLASFQRATGVSLGLDFDVKVALLPDGKDPADVIAEDPNKWKACVKDARHSVDFLLETFRASIVDDRAYKQKVSRDVLPVIAQISNAIDRSHFVSRVANVLRVPETSVHEELRKVEMLENSSDDIAEKKITLADTESFDRQEVTLGRIMGIIEWQKALPTSLIDIKTTENRLHNLIGSDLQSGTQANIAKKEYAFEAEISLSGEEKKDKLEKHLEELFIVLEEGILHKKLESSILELKEAESSEDVSLVKKVLTRTQDLARRIEELKRKLQHTA